MYKLVKPVICYQLVRFVISEKNREEFDELFFVFGGRWGAINRRGALGKTTFVFRDGELTFSNIEELFKDCLEPELSDEEVLAILRDKAGRTMTVDQTIEGGDFVYIPHLGEGLYKPTKDGIRFTVKNRNDVVCSFDKNGKDVIGIKIAFKYSQRNQKLLTELFNKKFLSKNDAEDVRTKLEDLVKNGFNILSVKEGDSIKAFTKDQIDQIVELTSKNPDANILHPITGIEL